MKKQKSLLIIGLSLIAIAMVGGTSAYFATAERSHNVITSSGISIELIETAIDDTGSLVPFENIENAVPGIAYSKRPQVHNTDDGSAWIRIRLDTSAQKDNESLPIPEDALLIDFDLVDWTEFEGHYYYNTALSTNELTEPLFTEVKISEELPEIYQGATFNISLTAEAVQSANNGTSPLSAGGWNE